jgi:hypothetical protein
MESAIGPIAKWCQAQFSQIHFHVSLPYFDITCVVFYFSVAGTIFYLRWWGPLDRSSEAGVGLEGCAIPKRRDSLYFPHHCGSMIGGCRLYKGCNLSLDSS